MKILYITQTFPPEPGATSRPLNQSLCLKERGHQITVLTTMPNYPAGRIYEGYRWKLFKRENYKGIDTVRIWSFPAKNKGKFLRIFSHLSFAFLAAFCGLFLNSRDVVIASVPNIGTDLAGLMIAKLKKSIAVLELRDVIPDNLVMIGITEQSYIATLLEKYYKFIFRKVDIIMATSNSMNNVLISKGVKKNKVIVVPHGADAERQCDKSGLIKFRASHKFSERFLIMYTGSFSPYYDVINYLHAARILKMKNKSVEFILIGEGPDFDKATRLAEKLKLNNVKLLGSVKPHEVSNYQAAADLFITSLASPKMVPAYLHNYITTKVAEYLMAGKPVVAVEDENIIGDFIRDNNLGTVVPCKNPDRLVKAITCYLNNNGLLEQQGRAARRYALRNLDRENIIKNFDEQLTSRFPQLREL